MNFQDFCNGIQSVDNQVITTGNSVVIKFRNARGADFTISPSDIVKSLEFIRNNHLACQTSIENHELFSKASYLEYQEKPYRALYDKFESIEELKAVAALGKSQTKALTQIITKFICYFAQIRYLGVDSNTQLDVNSIEKALKEIPNEINKPFTNSSANKLNSFKQAFQNWLKEKNKSEKTIKEYSETVINCADKIISSIVKVDQSLYDVKSILEAEKLISLLDNNSEWEHKKSSGHGMYIAGTKRYLEFLRNYFNFISIPKGFLLLAGISGTGKSRFVREQARDKNHYCLVPVRPDWHEPSDLTGYVSRIGSERYVTTELLCFIAAAWRNAWAAANKGGIELKPVNQITPYWLCLDEMNLAPVEQYFADYLAVLETRVWTDNKYHCFPLLKAEVFNKEAHICLKLRKDLGLEDAAYDGLWEYFSCHGIPLPPNLIVAGTVNMDETTHGFSRKVIDRALTIDFGCFFPNDFDDYFEAKTRNKILSFPLHSCVRTEDLRIVAADPDGQKSIGFISAVNKVLKDTPFELAFRALNELLISLVCFKPETPGQLQAVWDDFLMTKVLPRIDGDTEKLRSKRGTINLLEDLSEVARQQLSDIWDSQRPDLLREKSDGTLLNIDCHSKKKMAWMSKRLADNGFTSFWP